jgi:serine/threonine protein kinase
MMHQLGICHCDIKPSNIMYSPFLSKFVFIDYGLSEYKNL